MSTRSTITIINPDLSAKQVYCHWDSYLSHAGEILQTAYNSPSKAAELISHGDISHLGFTNKPANLYKDGITMDNEFDKIYKPFGGKASSDYDAITDNYTFYYNRDRQENDKCNNPYTFTPKEVKASWETSKKWDHLPVETEFPKTNCSIAPSQEYNYIYDASSAHSKWYVTFTKLIGYRNVKRNGDIIGTKGGHWIFCFQPLLEAIYESNIIKSPNKELKQTKQDYLDFLKHPYNPTYKQFLSDMRKKYEKSGNGIKPTVKQHIINPGQMSLF